MEKIFLRTEHNYDRNKASEDTALICKDASRTKQEYADDADINKILERFGQGYPMPENTTPPTSGDFTNLPDYRAAHDMIRAADELFGTLPAKIRARFNNDPAYYIEFFHDPENYDEALKLGLVNKRPPADQPAPQPEVKTPPETPAKTA